MTGFALDDRYAVPAYEPVIVTPAEAGVQSNRVPLKADFILLDTRLRGYDGLCTG